MASEHAADDAVIVRVPFASTARTDSDSDSILSGVGAAPRA